MTSTCAFCSKPASASVDNGRGSLNVHHCSKHAREAVMMFAYRHMLSSFDSIGADERTFEDFQKALLGWVVGLWQYFEGSTKNKKKLGKKKGKKARKK